MRNMVGYETRKITLGQSIKGLERLVKEVLIYFTDTLEAMKDFGNSHKNH